MASGALTALAAACGEDRRGGRVVRPDRGNDADLLTLALEVEHLQESFYRVALERGVATEEATHDLLAEVHEQERSHAGALEVALRQLGERSDRRPDAAAEQLVVGSADETLRVALWLEELAASAYLSAVDTVRSEDLLATLLSIHSVEARQAAGVANAAGARPLGGAALPKPEPVSAVRGRLDRFLAVERS